MSGTIRGSELHATSANSHNAANQRVHLARFRMPEICCVAPVCSVRKRTYATSCVNVIHGGRAQRSEHVGALPDDELVAAQQTGRLLLRHLGMAFDAYLPQAQASGQRFSKAI